MVDISRQSISKTVKQFEYSIQRICKCCLQSIGFLVAGRLLQEFKSQKPNFLVANPNPRAIVNSTVRVAISL